MRCFLSYAREDVAIAEEIGARIVGDRHKCFVDVTSLQAGASYDAVIRSEIRRADVFIFLISPRSVGDGRYTKTELRLAQEKWPRPHGRVIPVMIEPTEVRSLPAYLKALTILAPKGNLVAEVASEIEKLRGRRHAAVIKAASVLAATLIIGAGATAAAVRVFRQQGHDSAKTAAPPEAARDAAAMASSADPPPAGDRSESASKPPAVVPQRSPSKGHTSPKRERALDTPSAETNRGPEASSTKALPSLEFFDPALMVPDLAGKLAEVDALAHLQKWRAADEALTLLSSGHAEPRLWLAAALIYAHWDYPTHKGQAQVELERAERQGLPAGTERVAASIRRMLGP